MNSRADRNWARHLVVAGSVVLVGMALSCSSRSATDGAAAIVGVSNAPLLAPSTIAPVPMTTVTPDATAADPPPSSTTTTPAVHTTTITNTPRVVEVPRQVTVTTSPQTLPPVTSPPVTAAPTPILLGGLAGTVAPGVVDILGVLPNGEGDVAATGMVLSPSGLVMTNNHVVVGATSFTATEVTTGRTYQATVVGTNPTADVAVIKMVGASGLPTIKFGNSANVYPTEAVSSIGNAAGAGVAVVAKGTVEQLDQQIIVSDAISGVAEVLNGMIQTNTQTVPGDSGGPLFDQSGSVIGMMTAGSPGNAAGSPSNEGYAIPINVALSAAQGIE